jgi:hypothetical protein
MKLALLDKAINNGKSSLKISRPEDFEKIIEKLGKIYSHCFFECSS